MGFLKKSEYARYVLFMKMPIEEKINKIHDKVFENEWLRNAKSWTKKFLFPYEVWENFVRKVFSSNGIWWGTKFLK